MPADEYELEIHRVVASDTDDLATKYELIEYFCSSRRRVGKLEWSYTRPGGCEDLTCQFQLPHDTYGLSYRDATANIRHFDHVVLRIRGRIWWQGTVESVARKLATPETVTLVAKGYAHQAEKATISWTFARRALRTAGDVGEIPGVVRSLWLLMPLLFGTEPGKPNPLADTCYIEGSTARPRSIQLDTVTVWETFNELAALAGNYDWGVDENRQLYFRAPDVFTAGTARYTGDPAVSIWTTNPADPAYGTYADETYSDPQGLPPHLAIDEDAVFVIGRDVETLEGTDSVQLSKNTLKIIAAPKKPGNPPQIFTVADPEWLAYWDRKLTARIATPFFSAEADVRRWGLRRLKLAGPPQVSGGVKGITLNRERPLRALGAVRIINPVKGTETVERIQTVRYTFEQTDALSVSVEVGYQPPEDQYFAEQLRRDATLTQNSIVGELIPFILGARMRWYRDTWTASVA